MALRFQFILLFLLTVCLSSFSQVDSIYVSTSIDVNISSIDYSNSRVKLLEYIKTNGLKIQKQYEGKINIDIDYVLNEQQFQTADDIFQKLGYVMSKKINTINNYNKVKEIELEIKYLKVKRDSYTDLINKMGEKSENYYSFWKDLKNIEENIYNKEKELLAFSRKENRYAVSLNLTEENTTPDETKISFVNMPGIQYSYLQIESPFKGVSADAYQGYFVKYLFTRGKSYFLAGDYKEVKSSGTDSTRYSELFLLGFGQDFYTRHLGHGKRKFLNLYSGYSTGGLMATSNIRKSTIFYIAPSIGLELFKNKYMLFDTNVSYFIPFSNNRNLRGISYNTSFNFVF